MNPPSESEDPMPDVVLYGSDWCPATRICRRRMDLWGVAYRYVEVDDSPEDEQRIADWNNGRAIRPTLAIGDTVFVDPSPIDLKGLLTEHGAIR